MKIFIGTSSFASLLTVDRFKRLEDIGLGSIRVGIYGDTPELYDAVHGTKNTDLFRKIKDNLALY